MNIETNDETIMKEELANIIKECLKLETNIKRARNILSNKEHCWIRQVGNKIVYIQRPSIPNPADITGTRKQGVSIKFGEMYVKFINSM